LTVVSDQHRLVFLHVPKCAGSTLLHDLRRHADPGGDLVGYRTLPDGGELDLSHLTLAQLADHFPDVLDKLRVYESYAILREPNERFASALAYYMRTVLGRPLALDRFDTVESTLKDVCTRLSANEAGRDRTLAQFQRQIDYVKLDGTRLVRHLYPITQLQSLADDLRARHGIDIGLKPVNTTRAETPTARMLKNTARPIYRLLPKPAQARLRAVYHVHLKSAPGRIYQRLYARSDFRAFVMDYYAADFVLYNDVCGAAAKPGLAE
jgi:hypothetical protein